MNVEIAKLKADVGELRQRIGRDVEGMNDAELLVHAITLNTRALLHLADVTEAAR